MPSPTAAALGPYVRFLPFTSRTSVLKPSMRLNVPLFTSSTSTLPVLPTGTQTRALARS
jgi:hypothetical protein